MVTAFIRLILSRSDIRLISTGFVWFCDRAETAKDLTEELGVYEIFSLLKNMSKIAVFEELDMTKTSSLNICVLD